MKPELPMPTKSRKYRRLPCIEVSHRASDGSYCVTFYYYPSMPPPRESQLTAAYAQSFRAAWIAAVRRWDREYGAMAK